MRPPANGTQPDPILTESLPRSTKRQGPGLDVAALTAQQKRLRAVPCGTGRSRDRWIYDLCGDRNQKNQKKAFDTNERLGEYAA